jgi:hypothetical protein
MNSKQMADEAERIVVSISKMLGGRGPELQGLVVADLLAMWLAGHPESEAPRLLRLQMKTATDIAKGYRRQWRARGMLQ